MRLASRSAVLSLATAAALALTSGTAVAAPSKYPPPSPSPVTVAEGLVTPLSFDVSARGDLYVGQAFAGFLTKVPKRGTPTDVVSGAPEVVAVSVERGVLTWAESVHDEGTFAPVSAVLKKRLHDGTVTEVDLLAYESMTNADGGATYGVLGLSEACQATLPPFLQPGTGGVDSHPYGSVSTHRGTYVADAGANAVLRVDRRGQVSTVAVLPPTVVDLTPEMVAAAGLDPCVAEGSAHLEPVPTDVEVGRHGMLYVSTLPGGPEDGSLGANGSVYRVHPGTGAVELVATGFAGATNLAVAPGGTVYVAEMFGGKVSAIGRGGEVSTVLEVAEPAAVEWHGGRLYVSSGVFTQPGAVVALRLGRW